MKVSKANPVHWLYLVLFGLWVTCAIVIRPFRSSAKPYRVVLYGHTLSGNLLAIYRYVRHHQPDDISIIYLCLDPHEYRRVIDQGENVILATQPACARLLGQADAVITDHGLHSMKPLLFLSDLKFFDVWHGIPFKGFDADDFRTQHRYDEIWVPSPLMADIYVNKFGFEEDRIQVTGYARTDPLVDPTGRLGAIKQRLNLPAEGKLILFAPTWRQDDCSRSIYPFDSEPLEFLVGLASLTERTKATCVIRSHLNTVSDEPRLRDDLRPAHIPFAQYPDTEEILQVADMLICDWSSIAFDYLLLDRPTIFLDVPAPFAKGFSLGPEYRFGEVVENLQDMLNAAERFINEPASYQKEHGEKAAEIRRRVFGDYADGRSAERCIERLAHHLEADKPKE